MTTNKITLPTVRKFRRHLIQNNFEKRPKRGKGDHELWVHTTDPTRRVLLDTGKDTPKLGTFKQMLKSGKLNEEDFR